MFQPRTTPCASCPYRHNAPSGVWATEEYKKLPAYDAETPDQPTELFLCHQTGEELCSGWVAHADPANLLALRLGVIVGTVDPMVFDYTTHARLFDSGAEACAHGLKDIEKPDTRAQQTIRKLIRKRNL